MRHLIGLFLVIFLTSCVETVIVGGVATGTVIAREKTINDTVDDLTIEAKIIKDFTVEGLKNPINQVNVAVNKQRVLLTGVVDDANIVKKADEISWKVKGVKEVIDEIQVVDSKSFVGGFSNYFRDSSITAQISSRMLLNKHISTINIKVITVNQIVYLIGIAKNQTEIELANKVAAKTLGVKKVINHIILSNRR